MDDLAHARALCDRLGPTFCLTWLKGIGGPEALARMGAAPETIRAPRQNGPAGLLAWVGDAWTVVAEPGGSGTGADHLIRKASRGTEMVSLLCHAQAHFEYAVDGTTVAAFDPYYPAAETMWGSNTALLRPLMDALSLRTPDDEADTAWQDAVPRAVVLTQRITGFRVPLDLAARAATCGGAIVVP